MTKALLRVRFRALFHSMLRQGRRGKRAGMTVLFILLFAYVGVVFCGMFALMFSQLAPAYHTAGLDWLYFATAGLMALGLSVFGSVFATQSQIYDAKDNWLLLSMPIPPKTILLSRVLPLLALNGVFSLVVLGPAGVIYGTMVGFTPLGVAAFVLCCLGLILLSQSLCCLLGWLLHLLLGRINKSLASAIYMVLFLGLYFYLYSQAGNILNAMAAGGASMASTLRSWVSVSYTHLDVYKRQKLHREINIPAPGRHNGAGTAAARAPDNPRIRLPGRPAAPAAPNKSAAAIPHFDSKAGALRGLSETVGLRGCLLYTSPPFSA